MKLASLNLENLFDRARAMNLDTWAEGRRVLELYSSLNKIFTKPSYSASDNTKIRDGVKELGLTKSDESTFVRLRQNKGRLLKRSKTGLQLVATGRGDWVGWLELRTEAVDEIPVRNTAQVVRDVDADVFGVVEVDNRIALQRFNDQLLPQEGGEPYAHAMVIDGNDDRGIDVGIMTRAAYLISAMRSHVDDIDGSRLFSRDCPEYFIDLPSGDQLVVLVNHFKSKGYGKASESDERRRQQAQQVRAIYDGLRQGGAQLVAILGDFNDGPDSGPLSPLLGNGSDLRDVSEHPNYQDDGRPGTFGNGTKGTKFDYILLSPELLGQVKRAEVFRKGVWGGKNGTLWPIYSEMKKEPHAASDHAAIWAEVDI